MGDNNKFNRRGFIGGQIALVSTIAFCGVAHAQHKFGSLDGNVDKPTGVKFKSGYLFNPATWENAVAEDISDLVGSRFTAMTDSGVQLHMTLVEAKGVRSGSARPKSLPRREGVSMLFESDQAADMAKQDHQSVWISHPSLGQFNVFLGAVPSRDGRYYLETILN